MSMPIGPGHGAGGVGGAGTRLWQYGLSVCGLLVLCACGAVGQAPAGHAPSRAAAHQVSPHAPAVASIPQAASSPPVSQTQWTLTWSDEFNNLASLRKWNYVTDGNGGYLKQLQWYDAHNATIDGTGDLVVTASRGGAGFQCWYGACQYRSVRMNTLGTFAQAYGRFEARIKLPAGRGLWPAFWMEGANVTSVGWPTAGEIDIVEPDGKEPVLLRSFAHAPHYGIRNLFTMPSPLSSGFHVYGVDWSPKKITWWVDGHVYAHLGYYPGWPFDHPFFLILDLAVGGGYPGPPNAQTLFPAHMLVDWIRVYRAAS